MIFLRSENSVIVKTIFHRVLVCTLLVSIASVAQASVVITGTRVIFPANEREVSVKLNNNGVTPALVQTWIDDGDINMESQARPMPFTLLPPIFRIEPGKGQTLRMIHTGSEKALPQDRESVFYLNMLEIPPKPADAQTAHKNYLQVAFRSRIKIFYRPEGLPGTADEAPAQVVWRVVPDGKGYALHADNPTPYTVNIAGCTVKVNGREYATPVGGMIPPLGGFSFPIPKLGSLPASPEITYITVNDHGAFLSAPVKK